MYVGMSCVIQERKKSNEKMYGNYIFYTEVDCVSYFSTIIWCIPLNNIYLIGIKQCFKKLYIRDYITNTGPFFIVLLLLLSNLQNVKLSWTMSPLLK